MTVDQWGTIALSTMVAVALLGSPLEEAYKNGAFKKLSKKTKSTLYAGTFSVILVIAILSAVSFYVEYVDFTDPNNVSSFGQAGDFFGGILNPIFGFITVLLLLRSLIIQNNDLDHAKSLRDLEILTRLLKDSKQLFRDQMNAELLQDEHGSFSYHSIFFGKQDERFYKRFDTFTEQADSIVDQFDDVTRYTNFYISDLISSCNKIISTYVHIIEIEDIQFVKAVHASDLLRFTQEARYYRLISEKNCYEVEKRYSGYLKDPYYDTIATTHKF